MTEHQKLKTLVETVLKRQDDERKIKRIISVDETDAVPRGENYLSRVTRVRVVTENFSGEKVTRRVIRKELPSGPFSLAYAKQGAFFVRELTIYRDVLTLYDNLLEDVEYQGEAPWPRCIDIEPYSSVILEDLQHSGYKMSDKFQGLDLDHCVLALRNLSLFHALSFLAGERGFIPHEVFSSNKCYIYYNNVLAEKFHDALAELVPILKFWGNEWDLTASKIQALLPAAKENYLKCLETDRNRLNVLNHGDSWANNMVFKYDLYSGKPNQIKFLDFQLAHYNSPALDVVYFFAFSPKLDVRRDHLDYLIDVYHQSLMLNMDALRVTTPRPSLRYIRDEIDRLGFFNLATILQIIPSVIIEGSELQSIGLEKYLEKQAAGDRTKESQTWWNAHKHNDERYIEILKTTLRQSMQNAQLLG